MKYSEYKEGMTVKLTKLLQPCDYRTEGKEYTVTCVFDDGVSIHDDDKENVFCKWEILEKLFVYEPVSYRTVNKLKVGQILYWYDSHVNRTDTFQVESITDLSNNYIRYNFKEIGDSYLHQKSVLQQELDRWIADARSLHFSLDTIKPLKLKVKKEELVAHKRCIIRIEKQIAELEQELG